MSDERADLRLVLEHFGVALKSRSSQMVQCPLHTDRTPSCSVNLDKGLWNCKSCGKAGDAYTLIMEMEDLGFVGAKERATTLGLTDGGTGGGDSEVSEGGYASRRKVPSRKGDRPRHGGYIPNWRRN